MSHSSRSSTTVMPLPLYVIASGSSRHVLRAVEPALGLFRDALEQRLRASRRRSTRVARRHAHGTPCRGRRPSPSVVVPPTRHLVEAVFGRREPRAVLAVVLDGPLHRHVFDLAGRRRDVRRDAAVVDALEFRDRARRRSASPARPSARAPASRVTITRSGTPSTSQRASRCQNVWYVGSFTSILRVHPPQPGVLHGAAPASCRGRTAATPARPARGRARRCPSSSTVAPGLVSRSGLSDVSGGRSRHFAAASLFLVGDLRRRMVGADARRLHDELGRRILRSARRRDRARPAARRPSGVPAQPPSENDRGPPSISRPPPRTSTKSLEHPQLLGRERRRLHRCPE